MSNSLTKIRVLVLSTKRLPQTVTWEMRMLAFRLRLHGIGVQLGAHQIDLVCSCNNASAIIVCGTDLTMLWYKISERYRRRTIVTAPMPQVVDGLTYQTLMSQGFSRFTDARKTHDLMSTIRAAISDRWSQEHDGEEMPTALDMQYWFWL